MKIVSILIFTVLLLASCGTDEPLNRQPNIILIVTDDQGWGDLSLNGNPDVHTPNIDALASNGTVLNNFYVSPVCSPTRAEVLTGRYHTRGGVYSTSSGGERLDLDEVTIADVFKQDGYKTAAYGKWHNGMQYPYHPNARGFEDFYGFCSGHWGNYFSPMLEHNGQIVKGEGFIIDDLTNKAMNFITANKENPFLLYVPFNTPHSPMAVPDKWWDKFKDVELKNTHGFKDKEKIEHTRAAYALCENIDWNVGRIMSKVAELGLDENTIVIYMSDNGPNGYRLNGGMKGVKGSTDEGGVRSPFIIQWKGKIAAGEITNEIASAIDLLPTLADMAEIETEWQNPLDGISLKKLLMSEGYQSSDRMLASSWRKKTSIRNQNFRLDHEDKLYHIEKDRGQTTDVSKNFPEVHEKMLAYKTKWNAEMQTELSFPDERAFPVGHPDFAFTQLPARDAKEHGNIKRSNYFPNCTFFTNWISTDDYISWDVEVLETGNYEAVIYYTCTEENIGSEIALKFGDTVITKTITEAFDSEFLAKEKDRFPRMESYAKDFKPLSMGTINLKNGKEKLMLKANTIPGKQAMDFRLLMLTRVK